MWLSLIIQTEMLLPFLQHCIILTLRIYKKFLILPIRSRCHSSWGLVTYELTFTLLTQNNKKCGWGNGNIYIYNPWICTFLFLYICIDTYSWTATKVISSEGMAISVSLILITTHSMLTLLSDQPVTCYSCYLLHCYSPHYSFYVTLALRSSGQDSLHQEASQTLISELSEFLMVLPLLDESFLWAREETNSRESHGISCSYFRAATQFSLVDLK